MTAPVSVLQKVVLGGGIDIAALFEPRSTSGKYACKKWHVMPSNCNNDQIETTFREVFKP